MLRRLWEFVRDEYAAWQLGRAYKDAYRDHEFVRLPRSSWSGMIDGPYEDEADLDDDGQA